MANQDDKKKKPPQPIKRVQVGGDKKQPPQPVRRVQTGAGAAQLRVRPTARAARHQANVQARPMPTPPQRRVVRQAAVSAAEADAEVQAAIDAVVRKFENLTSAALLGTIYDAVGRIDTQLAELPFEVEKLRDRGYVHSGQLEDKLEALDKKWENVRPRVEQNLREQVQKLDRELDQAEAAVNQINSRNNATIRVAETAVDSLDRRINAARDAVDNLYEGLENEVNHIQHRVNEAGEMLDLLDSSPSIQLRNAEGPLMAVETEWHRDGKEGPDGYLFLTDQRLIFEQREEIVTKKRFGLFKAESEKVQEVHIDVEVHQIESVEHKEEGGFLGMGKADILELVFAASANISRARFHLKGQESSEWAAMIKRVKSGDIDKDRSDDYVEELETAGIVSASFPTQCSNCYAAIPEQPRGVTSYTCEFCGTVTMPS